MTDSRKKGYRRMGSEFQSSLCYERHSTVTGSLLAWKLNIYLLKYIYTDILYICIL